MKTTAKKQGHMTLVKQACLPECQRQAGAKVSGFEEFYKLLSRKFRILGRSQSTLLNCIRHLAQMALYFECVPIELEQEQVEEYLDQLLDQHSLSRKSGNTPSESYFKFTVYGLRFALKANGLDYRHISLLAP
jgi:hypothetical protein